MIFSVEKLTPNIKYGEPPFQSTSLKDIRISPTDPWKPVNIMIKKGDSLFIQTSGGQIYGEYFAKREGELLKLIHEKLKAGTYPLILIYPAACSVVLNIIIISDGYKVYTLNYIYKYRRFYKTHLEL